MGRKKGRNSGSRHDGGGSYSKQGSLVVQLQRYRHVSQGCSAAASRPAYYEHKQFPDLDAIINARRDDDRVEAVYGFSALDLPRPVAVKVDASRVRCDGDEEEENEELVLGRGYKQAAELSRNLCFEILSSECYRMISDKPDEEKEDEQRHSNMGIPSLSCLCVERLAKDLGDWSEGEDAASLGTFLRESLRPEFTTVMSIAASKEGTLNQSTLPAISNPMSRVLVLGNGARSTERGREGSPPLSVAQCSAFIKALRRSAAQFNSSSNAPDDWEVLAVPSHLSGIKLDVTVERGPTELFFFDCLFDEEIDIREFQSFGKGLKCLHLYSFTTSPTSVRSYSGRKSKPSIYRERCVCSFIELFLTTASFDELEHLTLDHCGGFRLTISGLVSIGHAIAETRLHQDATKHGSNGLARLRTMRVANQFGESMESVSLCGSFKKNLGIDLCVL